MNNYTDNFIFRIDNLEEFKADIDNTYLSISIFKTTINGIGDCVVKFEINNKEVKNFRFNDSISNISFEELKSVSLIINNIQYTVESLVIEVKSLLNEIPKYPIGTEVLFRIDENETVPRNGKLENVDKDNEIYYISCYDNIQYSVNKKKIDDIIFIHNGCFIRIKTISKKGEKWKGEIISGTHAHKQLLEIK